MNKYNQLLRRPVIIPMEAPIQRAPRGVRAVKTVDFDAEKRIKTRHLPIGNYAIKRSSQPTLNVSVHGAELQTITSEFNLEVLKHMEFLVATNTEFARGIDNIIQMANTPHDIYFPDNINTELAKEMRLYLKNEEKKWYNYSTGIHSIKADLLAQIALFGALSAETVMQSERKAMDSIAQIARVSPKYIRFVYDKVTATYSPYQIPYTYASAGTLNGMIKLNTNTYQYIAHRRYFDSPYPLPPFITAIRAIAIRDDMINNFAEVMKQLGVLGFLEALVEPPEQDNGENDEDYAARCNIYLDTYVYPQLEKTLGANMVAGFKNTHEFKLTGNSMNAKGAEDLMKIIDMIIFSGIKQDPNLLGRNYSTTETFGRVVLEMMISQVSEYQKIVDSFFARAYKLALTAAGYFVDYVEVESKAPTVRDRKAQAEAEKIEQEVLFNDYKQGLIDQNQVAMARGYDEPAEDEPRFQVDPNADPNAAGDNPKPKAKPKEETKNVSPADIERLEAVICDGAPVFEYHVPEGCLDHDNNFRVVQFGKTDPKYDANVKKYFNASFRAYRSAIDKAVSRVVDRLSKLNKNMPLESVQGDVYYEIMRGWASDYIAAQSTISDSMIEEMYSYFRKRKDMFYGKDNSGVMRFADDEIPDAVFDMDDYRAIEFYKEFDTTYLGKFITDPDTKKKVYQYIADEYIAGDIPIGDSPANQKAFSKALYGLLENEGYKIRRIVETTVNGIRNDASIFYMAQHTVVTEYEIFEIMDQLTCDYCAHMDGKTFKVAEAKKQAIRKHGATPQTINQVSPFATKFNITDFKAMNESQLQAAGIMKPAFHPHCRGNCLAVL